MMHDFAEEEHTEILARVVWARRRPSMVWLFGAALSFTVAIAMTAFAHRAAQARERDQLRAIEDEAGELGRAIDTAARAAHERADQIAGTRMVRAAILTDRATVADMMQSEFTFGLAPGEAFELFQLHDTQPEPLIRWPATAAALPPVADPSATLVTAAPDGPHIVVGAHVNRIKDGAGYDASVSGIVVLSTPLDLEANRRWLAQHVLGATLAGAGQSFQLVGDAPAAAGEQIPIPVPSRTARLTLGVSPIPPAGSGWFGPVRHVAFGLGAAFLIGFVAAFGPRRPRRA